MIGLENNRDGEVIIPISLKTIGSAGLIGTNEMRGLDGCWSIVIFQTDKVSTMSNNQSMSSWPALYPSGAP